jgi:nicotinamidase/pyrazinamidase
MSVFDYDLHTAVVVVDMQNDFADPGGSLYVRGGDAIIDRINTEVLAAVAAGAPVVYTQDWHPPETPHFAGFGGIWPVHCVRDTWGAELHPDLVVNGPIVRKGTGREDGYSGFTMRDPETDETMPTELHARLQERNVHEIVVTGLALDVCVKATVLDALDLDYGVSVLAEATCPVELEPGDGERAKIAILDAGGIVVHVGPVTPGEP